MKLAVLSCFYNFAGYKRPVQNLHRFVRQMQRDGAALFGVEAVVPRRPVQTNHHRGWGQVQIDPKTQTLRHKEALLNLVEKRVPEEYDAVAWVDADVWFSNPNWIADTEAALEQHDVVQMFDKCYWTSDSGTIEMPKPCVPLVPLSPAWGSHPGFAWAMRRDFWQKIGGLYPFALSGGGDSIMSAAFQGSPLWPFLRVHTGADPSHYEKWAEVARTARLGHVAGACYHEWHGTRKDRDYVGRAKVVSSIRIGEDIILGPNGLPMWTDKANPEVVAAVSNYFIRRNEDGNE
jgi:hypothetical protein